MADDRAVGMADDRAAGMADHRAVASFGGTSVLVADDHPPTRAMVREALEHDGFVVVADVATADLAVAAAERYHPDLALLDIRMPGGGIEAARALAALDPPPAIVMLTVSQDDDDLFAALRAGASGYLLKGLNAQDLAGKLRSVLDGEASLPGTLVAKLIAEFRVRERRRLLTTNEDRRRRLTAREWEILELMSSGLTTAQIADRTYVNPVTVRSHVAAILRKLQVPNRAAAVAVMRGRGMPPG
jgi:DNA-binding NarL/FixJ family response regulator